MQQTQATDGKKKRKRPIAPSSVTLPITRAAEEYGLSYKALRAAAFSGELPIIKVNGRNWYVRRSEIEKFLVSHTERQPIPQSRKRDTGNEAA